MNATEFTFWQLLSECTIEIPKIQRDYAHGRTGGAAPYIRKGLLGAIKKTLESSNERLNLDFIYGTFPHSAVPRLEPIDGQQRLTTLYLLHWYAAAKDKIIPEVSNVLKRFSYNTRPYSRDFCMRLSQFDCDLAIIDGEENALSKILLDQNWFIGEWIDDPTVSSMLIVLDEIHLHFRHVDGLFDSLTNKRRVFFQYNDMKMLKLDDDIYIKMNSRGKQLTSFESFKSKFEQHLLIMKFYDLKERFSSDIDGKWTDFFWEHTGRNEFDGEFIAFITFIIEVIYYRQQPIIENKDSLVFKPDLNDPDYWKPYLCSEDNINIMMSILDTLVSINRSGEWFGTLMSSGYEREKVALFSNETDLLAKCTSGQGFSIREKSLLVFCLIYAMTFGINKSREFIYRLRTIRNMLDAVRQVSWPTYQTNLRAQQMPRMLDDIFRIATLPGSFGDALANDAFEFRFFGTYSKHEKEKARMCSQNTELRENLDRLDDSRLFQGQTSNFLKDITVGVDSYLSELEELLASIEPDLVTSLMISCGYGGSDMGWSGLGARYFWGSPGYWYTALTADNAICLNLKATLDRYIELKKLEGSPEAALLRARSDFLESFETNNVEKDWSYYFVKYSKFIFNENNEEKYQFAWKDENNSFEIRRLATKTARGYHINPYVALVVKLLGDASIAEIGQCYSIGSDISPLSTKLGFDMYCEKAGWRIIAQSSAIMSPRMRSMLKEIAHNNTSELLLECPPLEDRVQIALDFLRPSTEA